MENVMNNAAYSKIEKAIRQRTSNDVRLVGYGKYIWLSIITCGIYQLVTYFKRVNRVDGFIQRKRDYYEGIISYIEAEAKEKNKLEIVSQDLERLKKVYESEFQANIKEIKAGMTLLLIIVTASIYNFIYLHKMNKVWNDLQIVEKNFNDVLNEIIVKLEMTKQTISFEVDPSKDRNYVVQLLLCFTLVGIFLWDYKIHRDPDKLFTEFHAAEDTFLQITRK